MTEEDFIGVSQELDQFRAKARDWWGSTDDSNRLLVKQQIEMLHDIGLTMEERTGNPIIKLVSNFATLGFYDTLVKYDTDFGEEVVDKTE